MSQILRCVTAGDGHPGRSWWCPGCERGHTVPVEGPRAWGFNGSETAPDLSPSVLVRWNEGEARVEKRCHCFVRAGHIQFLSDCTHALAGQTVPMVPPPGASS